MPRPLYSLSLAPATISALRKAGYVTLDDLEGISSEELASELKIAISECEKIIVSASRKTILPTQSQPLSQSASAMVRTASRHVISSKCGPVDALLSSGLPKGYILEISGPPGSPKELLLLNFTKSCVEMQEQVLFVDCQNMVLSSALKQNLTAGEMRLVSYAKIHQLDELMLFIHNLADYLLTKPISLLVISSISFLFQSNPSLSQSSKTSLLEKIKKTLARACTGSALTVVLTSQLATKLINQDGSRGKFETAARGVMAPQLGPGYLPSGRTYRIILAPDSPSTGRILLLSAPALKEQVNGRKERYSLIRVGKSQQMVPCSNAL